jgi:3'-phosphoadenosine 5'-phosphosulfate sulfotransferase (PAPS reductase)/FAD synthetase
VSQKSLFPPDPPRSADALTASAHAVIDSAFAAGAVAMLPLFSGGHDSFCACHVAARHPRSSGDVHHINTRIGAKRTREYVDAVCREQGWKLNVYESPESYEKFIRERGFPGPGRHHWVYARIKDRCVRQLTAGRDKAALITGCRSEESVRRMGNVEPLKVGEWEASKGRHVNLKRVWTAPCHDWTAEEQRLYMDEFDLPKNPVKVALGMSGECFCGAFASPGELDRIRHHCPDVAAEIDRLAVIANECGKHAAWGTRPPRETGLVPVKSGPLCSTCDRRAYAAGLLFDACEPGTD